MSTSTTAPTGDRVADILADYPLAVGATWEYSVQVTYLLRFSAQGTPELSTWDGQVTETITRQLPSEGKLSFETDFEVEPTPPDAVWLQDFTSQYVISGDGVLLSGIKVYQWPLADGAAWYAFPSDFPYIQYQWKVSGPEDVSTPFRHFKGCYAMNLITGPDTTIIRFCPGVGVVIRDYYHHGEPQIEHWILLSYSPG